MEYSKDLMPITEICLNVTEECNLACRYCFTEHHPNFITLQVAKDAATWLYNNAKIASQIKEKEIIPTIGFFGGEPTLMWDSIIVPLIELKRSSRLSVPQELQSAQFPLQLIFISFLSLKLATGKGFEPLDGY